MVWCLVQVSSHLQVNNMIGQVMWEEGGGVWGVYETAKLQKILDKTVLLFSKIPMPWQKFRENI